MLAEASGPVKGRARIRSFHGEHAANRTPAAWELPAARPRCFTGNLSVRNLARPITTAAGVLELPPAEANAPPVVPPTSGRRLSLPRCRAPPGRASPTHRALPSATASGRAHPGARSPPAGHPARESPLRIRPSSPGHRTPSRPRARMRHETPHLWQVPRLDRMPPTRDPPDRALRRRIRERSSGGAVHPGGPLSL